MLNIVSLGGGTNSTAMLIGMAERNWRPDLILFADTGGEKPHTYEHIVTLDDWLLDKGFPGVTVVQSVRKTGEHESLEAMCLRTETLPSVAFGFKTCSQRYKIRPQEKFLNIWQPAIEAWGRGERVTKLIGFDADESRRAKDYSSEKYDQRYPLIEWGWGREECVEAITRAGLPLPGKSSCFFCPNSKPSEILWLGENHPDLLERCFNLERNAAPKLITVKGLGRNKSWQDIYAQKQIESDYAPEMPCECYDGSCEIQGELFG